MFTVRRAQADRTDRGRRATSLHTRTIAQRTGLARSAPLSASADSRPAGGRGGTRRCVRRPGRPGRRPHAVLHICGAPSLCCRALFSVACRSAATRPRASRGGGRRGRCLTLGIRCRRGHELRRGHVFPARALGFSRVVRNSIDASSDRDFVASFLYAASMTMVHLSRLAEDLIIFTGEEHGFFDLSDASATGEHDAAEEEPRPARARSRQVGSHHWTVDGLACHDEGVAERLQQGFAGRQGSCVRC